MTETDLKLYYHKMVDWVGAELALALLRLRIGYDERARIDAARMLLPEGYRVVGDD